MRYVIVALALGCSSAGPSDRPDAPAPPDAPAALPDGAMHALPALPLATSSRWIVDATGARFKLVSVNWYGAESADFVVGGLDRAPVAAIAARIRALGFNSVRLPWSN